MNQDIIKVSIIIPVYKVEKYLRKCLDSVVAQTYKSIEVILVDDGSPDDCGRVCDEYAEKNPNFKVIHQQNQGQAAGRNHAVQVASGEFILFIDSDDFVAPDYVEYLIDLQRKYNADVTIGGFIYHYEWKKPKERKQKEKIVTMNAEEALICMNYSIGFGATPWVKLCKRELVLAHPFPVGQIYEDLATMYKIIGDARKIVFGSRQIYYWLQREGSTMHMAFDDRQMAGIEAASEQLKYMEARYPKVVLAAKARYMAKIAELMSIAFQSTNSESIYQRLKSEMRYYNEVMKDHKVKKTLKIRLVALKSGYYPAKIVFCVHELLKKWLL